MDLRGIEKEIKREMEKFAKTDQGKMLIQVMKAQARVAAQKRNAEVLAYQASKILSEGEVIVDTSQYKETKHIIKVTEDTLKNLTELSNKGLLSTTITYEMSGKEFGRALQCHLKETEKVTNMNDCIITKNIGLFGSVTINPKEIQFTTKEVKNTN